MKKKTIMCVVAVLVVAVASTTAFALTGGSNTTGVGYELYDLVVNKFINGPIGGAAGTGFIVVGAVMAVLGKVSQAIWPLIGGGMLAAASGMANSLGMIF